jgi:hypothetical protein
VFHEMLDPACATAEVPLQAGAHDAPAQSRPPAHGIVGVGDTQHALLNEVHDLAVESRLESIPDVAGKLLVQQDRLLSNRRVERHGLLDGRRRGLCAAHDFN